MARRFWRDESKRQARRPLSDPNVTVKVLPAPVAQNPERALNAPAKRQRQSRSDIVREALARYEATTADGEVGAPRPYDAWVDVIGAITIGVRHPARTTGEQLTDILRVRARARRAR